MSIYGLTEGNRSWKLHCWTIDTQPANRTTLERCVPVCCSYLPRSIKSLENIRKHLSSYSTSINGWFSRKAHPQHTMGIESRPLVECKKNNELNLLLPSHLHQFSRISSLSSAMTELNISETRLSSDGPENMHSDAYMKYHRCSISEYIEGFLQSGWEISQ